MFGKEETGKVRMPLKFAEMEPPKTEYDGCGDGFSWGTYFACYGMAIFAGAVLGTLLGAVIGEIYGAIRFWQYPMYADRIREWGIGGAVIGCASGGLVGSLIGIGAGIYFGKERRTVRRSAAGQRNQTRTLIPDPGARTATDDRVFLLEDRSRKLHWTSLGP